MYRIDWRRINEEEGSLFFDSLEEACSHRRKMVYDAIDNNPENDPGLGLVRADVYENGRPLKTGRHLMRRLAKT